MGRNHSKSPPPSEPVINDSESGRKSSDQGSRRSEKVKLSKASLPSNVPKDEKNSLTAIQVPNSAITRSREPVSKKQSTRAVSEDSSTMLRSEIAQKKESSIMFSSETIKKKTGPTRIRNDTIQKIVKKAALPPAPLLDVGIPDDLNTWNSPSNPYIATIKDPLSTSNISRPEQQASLSKDFRKKNFTPRVSSSGSVSSVDIKVPEEQTSPEIVGEYGIWNTPSNPYINSEERAAFTAASTSSVKTTKARSSHVYPNSDSIKTTEGNITGPSTSATQRWKRKQKNASAIPVVANIEVSESEEISKPSLHNAVIMETRSNKQPPSNKLITPVSDAVIQDRNTTSHPPLNTWDANLSSLTAGVDRWKRKKRYLTSSSDTIDWMERGSLNTLLSVPSAVDDATAESQPTKLTSKTSKHDVRDTTEPSVNTSSSDINPSKRQTKYTTSGSILVERKGENLLLTPSAVSDSSRPQVTDVRVSASREISSSTESSFKTANDMLQSKVSLNAVLSSEVLIAEEDVWYSTSQLAISSAPKIMKSKDSKQGKKGAKLPSNPSFPSTQEERLQVSLNVNTIGIKSSSKTMSYSDVDAITEPYFSASLSSDSSIEQAQRFSSHSDSGANSSEGELFSKSFSLDIDPKQRTRNTPVHVAGSPKKKVTFITPPKLSIGVNSNANVKVKEKSTSVSSLISNMDTSPMLNPSSSSDSETENGLVLWKSPSHPYI